MFILDTNSVAYFFKGLGRVAPRLLAVPPAEIAIPAIVLFELEAGLLRSPESRRRRSQLTDFLEVTEVLPFGIEEARAAARVRTQLELAGRPIGPHDLLIAGTALARNATLVTHNAREFGRVEGLRLDDWF